MLPRRIVLYRPSAGLYDILCQIGSCCLYAERWGRATVVDTNYHALNHFRDDFSKYFISLRDDLILDVSAYEALLDRASVVPPEIAGSVSRYSPAPTYMRPYMIDEETGAPLTFDFSRDHDAELLVHHAGGRSPNALVALERMRLHDSVRKEVRRRLGLIGGPFRALHIRATDYECEYRAQVAELRDKLTGRLFVATDNREALDFVRAECPTAQVFSFSDLPDQTGKPLHYMDDAKAAFRINLDAICDLILLAHSHNLYIFSLKKNIYDAQYSGYSALAWRLNQRRGILQRLMGFA